MIKYFFFLLIIFGCTKDLENQVNDLEAANQELLEKFNAVVDQLDAYEAQLAILEFHLANLKVSFDSPYVGCWVSSDSMFESEIQILPNGVGTLDFGTSVYQVFSWGVYEGETILHFGDISWCSCFGVSDQRFLFGELFEENQTLPIPEGQVQEFTLLDFDDQLITYTRCTVI